MKIHLLLVPLLFVGVNVWSAGPYFNVLEYGAHNDGSASSTEAFRSAIQAAKPPAEGRFIFHLEITSPARLNWRAT